MVHYSFLCSVRYVLLLSASYFITNWSVILLAALLGILVHFLVFQVLKRTANRMRNKAWVYSVKKLKYPTLTAVLLIALSIAYNSLELDEDLTTLLNHISQILFITTVAWTLAGVVSIFREFSLRKDDLDAKDNLRARKRYTQFRILERIIIAIIIIFAIGSALMTFEKIRAIGTSLLASAGIAGIIIGFAAQKSIATFLAGIQIAITQPIRIEDAVVVEGEWGWIEEITFTYVVIRIWDKRRLIVPINYFIEKPFQNWTRTSADILGVVYLKTDFAVPVDEIRKELDQILDETPLWDQKVKVVQVTEITDQTMELRILAGAFDGPTAWDLRVLIREKLMQFLLQNYPESLPRTRLVFENSPDDISKEGKIHSQ